MRFSARFAVAAAAVTALGIAPSAFAADVLPDLGNKALYSFSVDSSGGSRLLRFTTTITNSGPGRLQVEANPAGGSTSATPAASQRIFDSSGGSRVVALNTVMFFAGDNHNHWHLQDLEQSSLYKGNTKLRAGSKRGFCFYDNEQESSSAGAIFYNSTNSCHAILSGGTYTVTMGLSVGWGDVYWSNLAFQYIDITGLGNGRYRVYNQINPSVGIVETNPANNRTWADITIKGKSVKVDATGTG